MNYGKKCYKERLFLFKTKLIVFLTNLKFFILVSWKLDCRCFNEQNTYYYKIDECIYVAMTLRRKKSLFNRHKVNIDDEREFLTNQACKLDCYLRRKYKFRIVEEYLTFNEFTKLALLVNRKYFTDCNIIYSDIISNGINYNKVVDIKYIRV